MPKVDIDAVLRTNRTGYPKPYSDDVAGRFYSRLGDAFGLEDFGASHVILRPGAMSAQRHWHEEEDEMVVMIAGEAVLVEEGSRSTMRPGDCAIFPKGAPNGHHLVNESDSDCVFVAIGRQGTGICHYPDIDLRFEGVAGVYAHKDGARYEKAIS